LGKKGEDRIPPCLDSLYLLASARKEIRKKKKREKRSSADCLCEKKKQEQQQIPTVSHWGQVEFAKKISKGKKGKRRGANSNCIAWHYSLTNGRG